MRRTQLFRMFKRSTKRNNTGALFSYMKETVRLLHPRWEGIVR